jgi:hypothetical protein
MSEKENFVTSEYLALALGFMRTASRRENLEVKANARAQALECLEELVSLLKAGVPFPEAEDIDAAVEARCRVLEQERDSYAKQLDEAHDKLFGVRP